ncbi:hypothetical protein F4781DRAFT_128323 [Annulohypoxylon bovei var. microspora]|nr:hypothetical protein F4781DRAFT_128323 [Annulohypoxylon bovei var. microspora]
MAPPISNTSAEPTLYDILSLTPKHLEGQAGAAQQQKIVKQAYHRALLKYHPDKAASGPSTSSSSPHPPSSPSKSKTSAKAKQASHAQPRITFTVDQIQHAHAVLSDAGKRREYDRALRTSRPAQSSGSGSAAFQTGVETVDLDDLSFDARAGLYHRACRCGNARGYAFAEENLEEFEDDGVLMVECLDCSLWIRVLFAAAEDEDPADDVPASASASAPATTGGGPRSEAVASQGREGDAVAAAGEQQGTGAGRGFKFNWSFNWGISLTGSSISGSATAGTGSGSQR